MIEKTLDILNRITLKHLRLIWLTFFTLGIVGFVLRFATGEKLAAYGSYVPWGLWIAVYFHAIGIAGGAFAVGAFGYLRGISGFRENLKIIILVSAASLITGLLAVWVDLGHPFRMVRILYAPNFGSMLAFNAWMYFAFLFLLGLIYYLNLKKKNDSEANDTSGWIVPLLALGIYLAISYPSQSGAFFGVVDAKPFWSSALLPILFFASAIASGAAALYVVFYFLIRIHSTGDVFPEPMFMYLRRVILAGVFVYLLGEFSEYSLALWSPVSPIKENILLVLFGPVWWGFWLVHLGGIIGGLFLLIRRGSIEQEAAGALIIGTTFISARLNILIPGQSIPELKGLYGAYIHPRLSFAYTPSLMEYLVTFFIVSFGIGLLVAGYKYLIPFLEKSVKR